MSLSESTFATRLVKIKTDEDLLAFIEWFESFPDIEWTKLGDEPDTIKALVLNYVLNQNFAYQERILKVFLKRKQLCSDEIKGLLKRNCQVLLLKLCIQRFNEKNDEDCVAELLKEQPLQVEFTRTIMVGTKESLEKASEEDI